MEYGAKVEAKEKSGMTALIYASEKGHSEIVRLLLDHGALIEAKSNHGYTSFLHAYHRKNFDTVKLLLNQLMS